MLLVLHLVLLVTFAQSQQWGQVFPGLESNVVKLNPMCSVNGHPMCCGLLEYDKARPEAAYGQNGQQTQQQRLHLSKAGYSYCKHHREYISSEYENRHYKKANELIEKYPTDYAKRRDELLKFITSPEEVADANIWLERVRVHMTNPSVDPIDYKYLSRFRVTVKCSRNMTLAEWDEWIEPLTIHFRHPFAFEDLDNFNHMLKLPYEFKKVYSKLNITKRVNLMNNDYVLLKSGNETAKHSIKSNHYMFDAGSSRFDSSTFWFACGYLQRALRFDRFFAWEFTLLEPQDVWRSVPDALKPLFTFFNIPITSDIAKDMDCPLRFIKEIAVERDFVSFKLDVDNPTVEIPIALSLASEDLEYHKLVDEFFFEFHYNSEFLAPDPDWARGLPAYKDGIRMDIVGAYDLFLKLRNLGVRSHTWP